VHTNNIRVFGDKRFFLRKSDEIGSKRLTGRKPSPPKILLYWEEVLKRGLIILRNSVSSKIDAR